MPAIGNPTKYQDAPYFESVGTGSQTVWTLPWAPGFAGSLIVVVGGVPQPTSAFSVSGNQLTLSAAPANGARILVFGRGNSVSLLKPASGSVTSNSFDPGGVTLPLDSKNLPAITGSFKNLVLSATGTSAFVSINADELVLSSSQSYFVARSVNLISVNLAALGANGLDVGTSSTATWYSVWVIYNPSTATLAGLLSLSATAPSLPSGFTYKARVGWVRSDNTPNKYPLPFRQQGRRVVYTPKSGSNLTSYPSMVSAAGSIALTNIATSSVIPPSASTISVRLLCVSGTTIGAIALGGNSVQTTAGMPLPANGTFTFGQEVVLESLQGSLYWSVGTGGSGGFSAEMTAVGWEDNL